MAVNCTINFFGRFSRNQYFSRFARLIKAARQRLGVTGGLLVLVFKLWIWAKYNFFRAEPVPDKTRVFPGFDPLGLVSLEDSLCALLCASRLAVCTRVVPRKIFKKMVKIHPDSAISRSIFAVLSDFSIIFIRDSFILLGKPTFWSKNPPVLIETLLFQTIATHPQPSWGFSITSSGFSLRLVKTSSSTSSSAPMTS